MKTTTFFLLLALCTSHASAIDGWPDGIREVRYPSSADKSEQPALFYSPDSKEARQIGRAHV